MDIDRTHQDDFALQIARGLGWFSIGLGVVELLAPGRLARLIGTGRNDGLVRAYGVREIAAGVGLLTARNPTGWLWARVAGDALDLATLAATDPTDPEKRNRKELATAGVLGVTVVDLAAACYSARE